MLQWVKKINTSYDLMNSNKRFYVFILFIALPWSTMLAFPETIIPAMIIAFLLVLMRIWHIHWSKS